MIVTKKNKDSLEYDSNKYKSGEIHVLHNKISAGTKNLFIVSTPMQLLSAIEAQNHFKTENNVLVILFFLIRDGKNIDQMFRLSEFFPYSKLITFQNSNRINFFAYTRYLQEISQYEYKYLFFGYSTQAYRRMVANVTYEKLFFLDDGVHTLTTHKQLSNLDDFQLVKDFNPYPNQKLKHKIMRKLYAMRGFKIDSTLGDLNYFTLFNLNSYRNEEIVNHDFSHIRNLFLNHATKDKKVYFLGQPLVRAIKISSYEYLVYLKEIFDFYKDREICYVPHRTEEVSEELEALVSTYDGVEILYLDEPIEFYFMNRGIYPVDVASFITSALFSIKKIFSDSNPTAFEIDLGVLSKYHKENIELIYSNYKKENIRVLECSCKYSFKEIERGTL